MVGFYWAASKENSATGTRTRAARVRAEYPNQLDYGGFCLDFDAALFKGVPIKSALALRRFRHTGLAP